MIIDPSVIRQVSREKDIDAEKMFGALEEAMSSAARKYYHDKAMVTLIDRQSGEMTVYSPRTVVAELDTEFHVLIGKASGNRVLQLAREPSDSLIFPTTEIVLRKSKVGAGANTSPVPVITMTRTCGS